MRQHTGLLFVVTICFAVALFLQFNVGEQQVQATPIDSSKYDEIFKAELEKNLRENYEMIMSALDDQAATLSRIERGLENVSSQNEAAIVKEEPAAIAEADVVEEEVVAAKEPALTAPVRMSSSRWTVNGSWNPSKRTLIQHLAEHGVSADEGYTVEELHVMHDNIHNGFPAMGGNAVTSSAAGGWGSTRTVTRSYTSSYTGSRGGLFGGRLFRSRSYSSCAGGSCR